MASLAPLGQFTFCPHRPVYFISGIFRRPAATHFANSGKVGKTPFKGEMFRFISPLKIPLFTDQSRPRKLQITRLARKGKTRSFRYSSSPNGNRLCWISIGLPFRHPHWMYPLGTEDERQRKNDAGKELHRSTPTAPRGSTRGGASKRVAQTALWLCRTVATGGRRTWCQRPPRAGTFVPGPRTKLPRKRGSGGRLPLSGGDGRRPEGVG